MYLIKWAVIKEHCPSYERISYLLDKHNLSFKYVFKVVFLNKRDDEEEIDKELFWELYKLHLQVVEEFKARTNIKIWGVYWEGDKDFNHFDEAHYTCNGKLGNKKLENKDIFERGSF